MAHDSITEPINPVAPTYDSTWSTSTHDLEELRAVVAEMLLRSQLDEDRKIVYVKFVSENSYSAYAKFLDSSGRHLVYIGDLRLGYEGGRSPGLARQILLLLGVPQRTIGRADKAARKRPGEAIEYDVVLKYVEKEGISARVSADKMHWTLEING